MIMTMDQHKAFDWSNKQAIFEFVIEHLWVQGERSEDTKTMKGCLYRSGDFSCAVGCLIPNEFYLDQIEGCSVDHIAQNHRFDSLVWTNNNEVIWLLEHLQRFHDTGTPEDFRTPHRINCLATSLGLEALPDSFFEKLKEKVK